MLYVFLSKFLHQHFYMTYTMRALDLKDGKDGIDGVSDDFICVVLFLLFFLSFPFPIIHPNHPLLIPNTASSVNFRVGICLVWEYGFVILHCGGGGNFNEILVSPPPISPSCLPFHTFIKADRLGLGVFRCATVPFLSIRTPTKVCKSQKLDKERWWV